jgi:DNA ligase (NAD+)
MYSTTEQKSLFEQSKSLLKNVSSLFSAAPDAQIQDLQKILRFHEWRYYVMNDPIISDFEYDTLYKQLEALEAQHPTFITSDSPTQRVAPEAIDDIKQVAHLTPMLSLENSYNADDLKHFDMQVKKLVGYVAEEDIEYCVEPKFDGGTIVVLYENNLLTRAATRGNGVLGEEMTHNARAMPTIPLRADFSARNIVKAEMRGEALIRKSVFEKVSAQRLKEGGTLFANPRNAATGALRMKDARETAKRGLEAFVYQLGYAVDAAGKDALNTFTKHSDTLDFLQNIGFKVPSNERKVCKNIEEVIAFCAEWQAKRDGYEYELDGMVIKVNSLAFQEKCGYTSHHPRWAIAYKFQAKQATTKLLHIDFQIGKIGSVTPVAKLEPVQLAGVMVSSVSLHNEEFIKNKDIRIGDTVLVERAGDVIPYIVKAMEDLRDGSEIPVEFPKNCPSCQSPLIKQEDESAWRCDNIECEAQMIQRLIHHVSKDAMDMEGFGQSMVEKFYELGYIKNVADIYAINYAEVANLDGFGKRSAANLEAAIEKAKKNPIHRLLYSLSIHHFGRKVSKLVASEINHVMELKDWTLERFTAIKDVGPVVSKNVIHFFQNPKNIALLERMESLGVNLTQTEADKREEVVATGAFAGKTILFTGKLTQYTREKAEATAKAAGASLMSGVSSKLNILVVGEDAGSKLDKAKKIGTVMILTEQEFLDRMKEE